ncbi:hypothetical protein PF005_g31775 [Phytophthora fragariae]|uniref:Uncharacterized protein n=1 Tax=Phytophthora fragariae TaxID=53985 RepID=A0A6A3GW75_9STRA|nr:hypothetical protein PF003_g29874 [Phytophthora fragariae]KAE8919092.1 hypothetical protein PF009_g30594 [Phytophthora fragariae]KAE8961309.1 hypothetical protein PF011_g29798 [Phytophthora fragariae]KAE9061185.1 hypothetical protein PF010_g29909 [Phytophthora fragariae]KAE9061280.1 hypothetical protein PF007_g30314 [Phytophthora fragariae]
MGLFLSTNSSGIWPFWRIMYVLADCTIRCCICGTRSQPVLADFQQTLWIRPNSGG